MKGRIRIAAAGLVVMSVLTAMTSTAVAAHNGEFWSGSMLVILLAGMGLAGTFLGRERVVTDAPTIDPLTRRSGAQWGAPAGPFLGSRDGPPPGPALGTSSVPPPVSGAGPAAALGHTHHRLPLVGTPCRPQ